MVDFKDERLIPYENGSKDKIKFERISKRTRKIVYSTSKRGNMRTKFKLISFVVLIGKFGLST